MGGSFGGIGEVVGGLGAAVGGVGPVSLATWSLAAHASETILSLQQAPLPAVFLAIYRVTNTGGASGRGLSGAVFGSVTVETAHGQFALAPGTSIDVSTQTITIRSGDKPAHGTYQLLCNAMASTPAAT
jgi:hypothetical protein